MDTLINGFKTLFAQADEVGRQEVLNSLRALTQSFESRQDSMQRILFSQFQLPIVRIGCDINLFKVLDDAESNLSASELALLTKGNLEHHFLGRFLRFLASNGYINEDAQDKFSANKITKLLTNVGVEGGVYHYFDSIGPAVNALPDFLKKNNYQTINENTKCPLQTAHKTTDPAFVWVLTQPENFAHFNDFMAVQHMDLPSWLDVYPIEEINAKDHSIPFFVDVGGGLGHQSVALRKKLPDAPRIIVQDMKAALDQAQKYPKVEYIEQDFFLEQPDDVKGASIFYMRNILHDYPDNKAKEILEQIKKVMGSSSRILIDDMVIPDQGAHWYATQLDIVMMSAMAAVERTQSQWTTLIEGAGLRIRKIHTYTSSLQDSIIECVSISNDTSAGAKS